METEHFINFGYGWLCRHCNPEADASCAASQAHPRFMREGEAEERNPQLSSGNLARWRDASRRVLYCPRCAVEELVDKA